MGKPKRRNAVLAMDFFSDVLSHLVTLHTGRERFVLMWIWNNEPVFKLFVELVLKRRVGSKTLLYNGYRKCRAQAWDTFPEHVWAKVDELFLNKQCLSKLPQPLRAMLTLMRDGTASELKEKVLEGESAMFDETSYAHCWKEVTECSPEQLCNVKGCFLGRWRVDPRTLFDAELATACKRFPCSLVLKEDRGNLTFFYERKEDCSLKVIAVHLRNALEHQAMEYIRPLMSDLYHGHGEITRHRMATLDSHMTAFGPCWKRFIPGGGNKISFYTSIEKLEDALCNLPVAEEFQILADQYAQRHLAEIILALFMWKLPYCVKSFLEFSKPFLDKDDYDMSDLETCLGGYGPCAYQLFITKDFCSEVHADDDVTDFTLAYCSHPDAASTECVEFTMAKYNFRIPVQNGSLLAFDSSVEHGTPYRPHSRNGAYMGCLVINSALRHLTLRRQREQRQWQQGQQ